MIAPDLRWYGRSEVPESGYDLFTLGRDVAELVTRAGDGRPVAVVGHDWGGVIGWHVASSYPSLVERLVAVAGPHPARRLSLMATNLRRFLMSTSILFFQLPEEWSHRGRVRAGLEYYRELRRGKINPFRYYREHRVECPVLCAAIDARVRTPAPR